MSDNFLPLTQQLAAALESVSGVAETLDAGDVQLRVFKSDAPFVPDYDRFGNDEAQEDLAQAPDFVSGSKGTIAVGVNVKTSGVVGTEPAIGRYLEACGMKKQVVKKITVGAQAGGDSQFLAGETYSATGGKTGTIEADLSGAGTLRYIVTSGGDIADGDTVTANSDSATASGSSSAYAVKYTPTSTAHKTLTLQRGDKNDAGTADQDFLYRIRGAAGRGTMEFTPLDAIRFRAEYRGVLVLAGAGGLFTGVTYESGTEPKCVNGVVQVDGVTVKPAEIAFDCGTVVEMDPDCTTDGGTDGYQKARVASREPTITMAFHALKASELDTFGKLKAGTTCALLIRFGTTPQIVEVVAPKAQLRALTLGERAGRRTHECTFHLTRDTLLDNDFAIYFR